MRLVAHLLRELGDELALAAADLLRDLDDHRDELIAFPVTAVHRDPFPTEAKHLPGLGARRHLHQHFPVERRHVDAGAEHRLRKRNRDRDQDVGTFPGEEVVIRDLDVDVQLGVVDVLVNLVYLVQPQQEPEDLPTV